MDKSNTSFQEILQMHLDAGVDETIETNVPMSKTNQAKIMDNFKQPDDFDSSTASILSPEEAYTQARKIVDGINNVNDLKKAVEEFKGCSLYKTATNTVFSDGIASSKVMLIGEAPGANEDLKGIPFCGDSGKLLDKMLASIGLFRDKNVYITNTVFWRPPGNRRPTNEELKICKPFVEKHIAIIDPKVIIMVGSTASYALFGDLGPVTKQRQKIFEYENPYLSHKIPSVVIFHPSYLLRQALQKKAAWQDMLYIKKLLEK